MEFLRAITLIIALVVQALPVSAVTHGEVRQPKCGMTCCCAAHAMTCCCAEPSQAPPAPARTPPVTGRELVPSLWWTAVVSLLPQETFTEESTTRFYTPRGTTQSHVRLSVLFCSILI